MAETNDSGGVGGARQATCKLDRSGKSNVIHKALSHPVRRAILLELGEGGETSAVRISRSLDLVLSEVCYHMKRLRELACIELVRVGDNEGRGRPEKFYRLSSTYKADVVPHSALAAIVTQLEQGDGSPYAELQAIAEIIRSTGRPVTLPGEDEAPALTPAKLGQMTRVPLREAVTA